MSKIEDSAIEVIEEMSKTGYAVGTFAARVFYQVSNAEALKNGVDAFMHERFSQRLEYFMYEHDKIGNKEKQAFYEDLKGNKQNLNYLYEFVEKARTTTFDLHAKILAKLSVKLIKNKSLNYYESSLLSNMNTLNEDDFLIFQKIIHEKLIKQKESSMKFEITKDDVMNLIVIRKFINIGVVFQEEYTNHNDIDTIGFYISLYGCDFTKILDEVIT